MDMRPFVILATVLMGAAAVLWSLVLRRPVSLHTAPLPDELSSEGVSTVRRDLRVSRPRESSPQDHAWESKGSEGRSSHPLTTRLSVLERTSVYRPEISWGDGGVDSNDVVVVEVDSSVRDTRVRYVFDRDFYDSISQVTVHH